MAFKFFSYWLWFAGLTILSLFLANIPLFNLLAFEFCAVLALGASFAAAHLAVTAVKHIRRSAQTPKGAPAEIVYGLFARAFGAGLTLLIAPLVVISLNAFRVKNCDYVEGLLFYLLLPIVSCAYGAAVGTFFGLWLKRRWTGYLAYSGYIFITLLLLAYNLVFHPPVFGYHATFGYFPGPIYDERITISTTLLVARGVTLLLAWFFLTLAVNTLDIGRHTRLTPTLRLRKLWDEFRPPAGRWGYRIRLLVSAICLMLVYLFRSELGLRPARGYIENQLGELKETEHFKIYYEKGSRVEREIESIAQDHEFRYAQLVRYFQMTPSRKVKSYIYTSPEQKKRLIGAGGVSVEDPLGYGFHINHENFPHPVMKHELAHALTADWHPILKVSLKIGLHEGVAVAADWDEGKLTGHQWSKAMRQLGVAPSIKRLMGLGFWVHASSRSYTLAGSFVRFLVEQYGIEKFKRVFPTGNFTAVYGKPLNALTAEWEAFLEEIPLTETDLRLAEHRFKRPSIFQKPCAHEIAELSAKAWEAYQRSDFSTADRLFKQIHSHDPDNPRSLRGLIYTAERMEDWAATLKWAADIVAHPNATPEQIAEAKNVEGDAYWRQENHALARSRYQEVFELHASDALDRETQAKIAALSLPRSNASGDALDREAQSKIRHVLIDRSSDALRITLLHEVINELPTWGLAYYLVGRQLHFDREYANSNRYLLKAAGLGLPHEVLALENTRLMGVNAYHLRRYDEAIEQFQRIAANDALPPGVVLNAKDWIERCEWAMEQ